MHALFFCENRTAPGYFIINVIILNLQIDLKATRD